MEVLRVVSLGTRSEAEAHDAAAGGVQQQDVLTAQLLQRERASQQRRVVVEGRDEGDRYLLLLWGWIYGAGSSSCGEGGGRILLVRVVAPGVIRPGSGTLLRAVLLLGLPL